MILYKYHGTGSVNKEKGSLSNVKLRVAVPGRESAGVFVHFLCTTRVSLIALDHVELSNRVHISWNSEPIALYLS